MLNFRNLSLRRKQTLIIMLTSSVALLLACAAFVAFEVSNFRRELVETLSSLAEVVGNNTTAALDFNDPTAAAQTLAALRGEPNIVRAHVHTPDGLAFATYAREGVPLPPELPRSVAARQEFTARHLHLLRPIMEGSDQVGTIELIADLSELRERLWRYAGIAGLVLLVSLLVAYGISSRLQRFISTPILELAQVARSVALEKDYSVRATKLTNDELGQLVDGFNEMLTQIQARDAALHSAHDNLEQRVAGRTRELASSVALLNATLEASVDGIVALDLQGNITSYNKGFAELWRYRDDVLARRDRDELMTLAAGQLKDAKVFLARVGQLRTRPEHEHFDYLEFQDGRTVERFSKSQHIGDQCVGSVITYRDITERKRADENLRRTEALYRSAIAGAGAVPYSLDFETRSYVFIGEGIQALIGYAPHEVNGVLWNRITQKSIMLGAASSLTKDEAARRVKAGELLNWRCDMCITTRDGKSRWVSDAAVLRRDKAGRPIGSMGILQDITERKEAEVELETIHKQLLEVSRQGGMAEIATNVLHNVGNVLNSVNISTGLLVDSVKKSKVSSLARVVGMLQEHAADLGPFLTADPKGKQLPAYLAQLSEHLLADQKAIIQELNSLRGNIDHIKEIVAMQQSYATFGGVKEMINVVNLVEDSLRMHEVALSRHCVEVVREFEPVPPLNVEKHKILQILVNLLRNAKHACQDSERADSRLTVRVANSGGSIKISVADNGVGIPPENLTRIFNHGFTTRKEGHGFGLHSGALAAKEMGGSLSVQSDGPGQGATFTLELPGEPGHSHA